MCTIGIVGFGVVGKSLFSFLNKYKLRPEALAVGKLKEIIGSGQLTIVVWDKRALTVDEQALIKNAGGQIVPGVQTPLEAFIDQCDVICVSPGIDIDAYKNCGKPILCELDLFSLFFTKPVIAVTGSLGKTTTTKLLGKLTPCVRYHAKAERVDVLGGDVLACDLAGMCGSRRHPSPFVVRNEPCECLESMNGGDVSSPRTDFSEKSIIQKHIRTAVGGNIGIGMLDLVDQIEDYDLGVLELSSFQLDLNTTFAPDVAVWTNFYPNHLDRHKTVQAYFEAKYALIKGQRPGLCVILSDQLLHDEHGKLLQEQLPTLASSVCFTSVDDFDREKIALVNRKYFYWMYVRDGQLWCAEIAQGAVTRQARIFALDRLPDITFIQNWVQVLAALYFLRADMASLEVALTADVDLLDDHHHRVEHFVTLDSVDFYEDSKSTVIQATQAAVGRLARQQRPLIVIVGGMSKGVDRRALMDYLKSVPEVKKVYCFGSECQAFTDAVYCATLQDIVRDIKATMTAGDIVLFSPSGASFDFFDNYKHRGQVFQELVLANN